MAEHFQQQPLKDIQTKFASSDLHQRLAALPECLKFDQGLDLLAQQALTDSSEQVQQSAYWVLYGDNPYLTENVNPKSPNVLAHDTISCVAISSEHKIIVGGSWKRIRIWNLDTGELVHTLDAHSHWALSVAISSNGQYLVSSSADKTVKLWSLKTKSILHTFTDHKSWVNVVKITPDHKKIISGSVDRTIKVWDLESKKLIHTFNGHTGWVSSLAVSSDSHVLVSGSTDKTIKLWDLTNQSLLRTLEGHSDWIKAVAISSEHQSLITGSRDGIIKIWEKNPNTLSEKLNTRLGYIIVWIISAIFAKFTAGTTLIIPFLTYALFFIKSKNKSNFKFKINALKCVKTISGQLKILTDFDISPNGDIQVIGTQNGSIHIENPNQPNTIIGHSGFISSIAVSSDSKLFVSGSRDWIKIWDLRTGKSLYPLTGDSPKLKYLKISPEYKTLSYGEYQQFTIQGFDQYNKPIETEKINWTATGGEIKNGLFQAGHSSGSNFNIQATVNLVSCKASITILEKPKLTSLKISPAYKTLYCGEKQEFTVQGFDQYNKLIQIGQIIWTATGGEIKDGLFQAGNISGSSFTVQAQVDQVSCKTSITILEKPKLASLKISPSEAILYCGDSQKFSVKGFDQHNQSITVGQVTWTANNLQLPNNGMFIAGDFEETVTISATIERISQSVQVQVIKRPKLTSLSIDPQSIPMYPNQTHKFTVQGLDQRGNPISVGKVNWTQTGGEINDDGNYTVSSYSQGEHSVTASIPGQTISATAKVIVPSILTDLIILPNTISVEPNEPITFEVMGLDQVGKWIWVENVQWKCTPGGRINSEGVFKGGYEKAQVTVTAKVNSIEAKATVNVLPVLRQIKIYPNQNIFIKPNESITFNAIGYDQYGNEIETGNIFWEAPGKRIDQKGIFTAHDNDKGFYKVTAKVSPLSPYDIRSKILIFGIYTKLLARTIKLAEKLFGLSDKIQNLLMPNHSEHELQNQSITSNDISDNPECNFDKNSSEEISNFEVDFQAWVIKQIIKISVRLLDWVGESCINFALISDSVYVYVIPVLKPLRIQPETDTKYSQDSICLDLQEIGRIRLLRADEEIELARKIADLLELERIREKLMEYYHREPNEQEWATAVDMKLLEFRRRLYLGRRAKDKMVQSNLRVVVSIAKQYMNHGLPFQDLIQEGSLGLIRAAEKFDHEKGYKSRTYAIWWIRQAITRAIADQSRTIRLPVHLYETISRIKKTTKLLSQEMGRKPTEEEIAIRMEMTIEKLRFIAKSAQLPISLDTPIGKEEDSRLGDFIESDSEAPEDYVLKHLLREDVENVLDTLSPRERDVLRLRYGLDDGWMKTLEEIAQIFNVTRERIRQIEAKALRKLRHPNRNSILREYLD